MERGTIIPKWWADEWHAIKKDKLNIKTSNVFLRKEKILPKILSHSHHRMSLILTIEQNPFPFFSSSFLFTLFSPSVMFRERGKNEWVNFHRSFSSYPIFLWFNLMDFLLDSYDRREFNTTWYFSLKLQRSRNFYVKYFMNIYFLNRSHKIKTGHFNHHQLSTTHFQFNIIILLFVEPL